MTSVISPAPSLTTASSVSPQRLADKPGRSPGPDRFALFPARAFLAFGWLRAATEKIISPEWWSGEELDDFLGEQSSDMLPFMEPLTNTLVAPFPLATAVIVAVVQLALGGALLTGRRLGTALLTSCGLNTVFVVLGAVTPSAFYLVLQITLLLALAGQRGWLSARRRLGVIGGAAASMIALTPFIQTIHPAEVIDDPAIMLVTLAGLVAASQLFAWVEGGWVEGGWFGRRLRRHVRRNPVAATATPLSSPG